MQHDKLTASSSTGRETDDRIHSLYIPLNSQLSTRQDEIQGRLRYQRFIKYVTLINICTHIYERTYTWQAKKGKRGREVVLNTDILVFLRLSTLQRPK